MSDTNPLRHIENIVLLRNTPIFGGLAPSQLQRMAMSLREHRYDKGNVVHDKGHVVTALMVLKEGVCRMGSVEYREGDVIRPSAVFVSNCALKEPLVVVEECTIVSIDQSELYENLRNNPSTALRLIEWFAEQVEGDSAHS